MKRYCILDGDECALVEEKLDEAGIDYDWGPLDRLIVENDEDCDEVKIFWMSATSRISLSDCICLQQNCGLR